MLMELLDRGAQYLDSTYNPPQWMIDWFSGGEPTSAGEHMNEDIAMRIPAVRAVINTLADTMTVLPVAIYRTEKSGRRSLATDHPALQILNRQPNDETEAPPWWQAGQRNTALYGNGYSVIQRTGRGDAVALWQRDSKRERTKLMRDPDTKQLYYECYDESGRREPDVMRGDMLHTVYNTKNGLAGLSPVDQLKEAISGNRAAERYANELFRNGASVQGHYTVQKELSEPAYQRIKKSIEAYGEHGNRHKRMLLEEGMTFEQATIDANSTQMIEARNFMICEVARIWRVSPALIFVAAYGTKNPQDLFREFIMSSMLPWTTLWKGAIDARVLRPPFTCEFDTKKFMEGDPAAQATWYRTMFNIGYYSLNEIRQEQGDNPIMDANGKEDPNANEHFVPRNMVPLSKATDKDWVLGKSGGDGVTESPSGVAGGDGVTPGEPGQPTGPEAKGMDFQDSEAKALGGPGSGPHPGNGAKEKPKTGREPPKEEKPTDRAARSKAAYNPCTAEKQRESDKFEKVVASKIGAQRSPDNKPLDNFVDEKHGVELKVMHDQKPQGNSMGRVNMRKDSRERKEEWAKGAKGRDVHTVLIDNRDKFADGAHSDKFSGHHIYYKSGVGAYTMESMTKVKNYGDLKNIIKGDKSTKEKYGLSA